MLKGPFGNFRTGLLNLMDILIKQRLFAGNAVGLADDFLSGAAAYLYQW